MSEKSEIIALNFTAADRQELIQSLWEIFRIPQEQQHWIYEQNPSGPAHVVLAREQSTGKFAGSGGFFPWKLQMQDGKEVMAAQFGNIMTHPDFRRRGVFGLVTRKALLDLSEQGIGIIYGYSNDDAYPGHCKYGAFTIGRIRWLTRPLNLFSLIRLALTAAGLIKRHERLPGSLNAKSDRAGNCRRVNSFDERFDHIKWPAMQGRIAIARNSAYLNWKFFQRPNREHYLYILEDNQRLQGYAVIFPAEDSWTIMDLQATDISALRSLLNRLMQIGSRKGVALLSFAAMDGHPYFPILRRLGFFYRKRFYPVIIYALPSVSLPLPPAEQWLFTLGDQD